MVYPQIYGIYTDFMSAEILLIIIASIRIDQNFRANLKADFDSFGNPVPFGNKGVCVLVKGGSAFILKEDEVQANFNPPGATNRVVRAGK